MTANYRDNGNRFEITLWCAGANGDRVKVFVDDFRPMFFCARSVPTGVTTAAAERKPLPMMSLDGREIDCLYFNTYAAMQQAARGLRGGGYPVFETDVNPLSRYLMERMVCGSMTIKKQGDRRGQGAVIVNPHVRGGGTFVPELRVMSVSIDTAGDDVNDGKILRIACADKDKPYLIGGDDDLSDEKQLLIDFIAYVKQRDPDIVIGWNVINHTLRIIQERCEKNNIPFDIGRERPCRVTSSERKRTWRDGYTSTKVVWTARIPGRVVMDVPAMLRAYYHDPDEYHIDLDNCLTNAKSVLDIFNDAEILPNAIERSRRSGQLLDGVGGSVASFDHLYLPLLHRAGFAAGDVRDIAPPTRALPGGLVLDPAPGLYDNVLVFDFKSLYPSIIMTFMIDPLGYHVKGGDMITCPVGTPFSKTASILPGIIRELMSARAQAVKQKNPYLSQAIKILMNSFYGVLGSTGCRFFSENISSTITLTGQYILKISIEHIEKTFGKKVIYGDTDSIFVGRSSPCCTGGGAGMDVCADEMGEKISTETTEWLRGHILEKFGAESALELKYENHYRHFFIPSVRGGGIDQGAKKHYCGAIVKDDGTMELTFKGMESARSDWTALAREFQHELFIRFFTGQPLEDYIISVADNVARGVYDDMLTYRKRVRKDLAEYTANIPPHVQAAKLLGRPVRSIAYRVTKDGPQPIEKLTAPLDYGHYIDTQLSPVADSILEWMGKSFDTIVSGQQDLFG